ncbi:ATP-dependent DNA ligase [Phycicoccus sp. MAQZ13P-2]|uniref:ATP-dependent DNA ligase n=1 Tax=Phycicoccus mangrovi TaxID=2840470 RepID=UPI001C006B4A|nr:ATP-dependent DNA ligase [Phycicoccus mangrovi]MBT9254628.1 ATP-dependent DNA ligase [Phycicoccus mangrovi]MBT9273167.1 ATP-dependent DNA ligase [Phycicoccus mangrovi]
MADAQIVEVEGPHGVRQVRLSSPDRLMWPDAGITKGDLAGYVQAVGDCLVRHIGDRPVTLQRFPEGIEGEEFYQKNPPKGMPDWVGTVGCRYPSGRRHPQIVVDEVATAVWAVQMNTVTFHPWPVRTADTDRPDELRIDLDPQPGRTFSDAVEAAVALRELMGELGLTAWAKTSGNRGVHVYARVAPTHEFLDVRHGVIGIARELERRLPDLVTASWWKEERGERVFVDFNQACRDRTIASAYSPRPLPGAPVSMPVTWDELPTVSPGDFTVLTVPDVLEDRGDAWEGIDGAVGDVTTAIALWDRDVEERGLGELNFPPDYPKMPGEPPRVQPSKRRQDKADAEYMAPKAERDAALREEWGMPVVPPVAPMLAKPVKGLDAKVLRDTEVVYEPKWDGFRSIVFRSGDRVEIGSRNEKPMTRYFPEVVEAALANLPERCVVDGEIIVVRPGEDRLDFELLSQRIHPAASRVTKLSVETPARFVAFDLLALGDDDLTGRPFAERRALLEEALADAQAPVHLTPATRDPEVAAGWFTEFEGAGLDGLVAKPADGAYEPDKRTMLKIKHERTADCVVAGYRTHKSGDDVIGSLLLGIHDAGGTLVSVGVIGAFPMARRKELFEELQPLVTDFDDHPWAWAKQEEGNRTPQNAAGSRWAAGKDLSFTPLRPERVVEVRYDHMEGVRFRHTAQFVRWRPDKDPADCTYEQLDEPVSYDLSAVLAGEPT